MIQQKDKKEKSWYDILKSFAKRALEAIQYINKFNLVKLKKYPIGTLLMPVAIMPRVHGGYIIRKTETNFALTNYCIINGGHKKLVTEGMWQVVTWSATTTFQLADIKNILQKINAKTTRKL